MATIRQIIEKSFDERGMFPDTIAAIMENISDKSVVPWNQDAGGYPPLIVKMAQIEADQKALAYIDEHQPMAWYRPLFLPADELDKFLKENPIPEK